MKIRTAGCLYVGVCILPFFAGCGPSVPDIFQASGTCTIDGKPLPNAIVKFIPIADGLNGSHVASGKTDEQGNFVLSLRSQPGVYGCYNKVIIQDIEAPAEARGMDEESSGNWRAFKASLANRPIPKDFRNLASTPLSFEISSDSSDYKIEITR